MIDGSGIADMFAGIEIDKIHIFMEVEAMSAGTIVVADVAPLPGVVLAFVVKDVGIEIDAAIDGFDAFVGNGFRPGVEKCVGMGLAEAIGAEERVAATNDIEVAVEGAFEVDFAIVSEGCFETEIATQFFETDSGGEEFGQGARDQRLLGLIAIDGLFL